MRELARQHVNQAADCREPQHQCAGASLGLYFPIITLYLMRATTGIQMRQPERFQDFLAAVFKALWIDALNLNLPELTAKAFVDGGFDPAEIDRLANDAEVKAALRATTEEAVSRGVFGAPTTFVGDEMFFGQDRLDFVREALA